MRRPGPLTAIPARIVRPRCHSPSTFPRTAACLSLTLALAAAWSPADTLHLKNGGTLEGRIESQTPEAYRIRTTVGLVAVPLDSVSRVERGPSVFDEYDTRSAALEPTAQAQFALSQWCDEQGLKALARSHLDRALEIDPDFAPARAKLGFVRVGDLWVDGRKLAKSAASRPGDASAGGDEQKLIAAMQTQWLRRIRAIRSTFLDSTTDRLLRSGRAKILEIRDPLAIEPLVRVLSDGNLACRDALVEILSRFTEDEATMNLAVLALLDADDGIRRRALTQLARRNDPRVVSQFRAGLKSDSDGLIRRAAFAIDVLKDRGAVPDLIGVLTAQRRKAVETPVAEYIGSYATVFSGPTVANLGGTIRVTHIPRIGFAAASSFVFPGSQTQVRDVTVFRTEVLEALRSLTGVDFGFDEAAWRRWYEEQNP